MRHDDGNAAFSFQRGFDHVADEGVVALALGRHAAPVAVEAVVRGIFCTPFVERERRVSDNDVEFHQAVVLDQRRAGEGVAPFDARAIHAVQEHVHARQRPGAAVGFHAEQREIAAADGARGLDQQTARAAGRVADAVTGLGLYQLRQQFGYLVRGVKLARLLAGIGGEALDQVDIGVADHVFRDAARAHVELRAMEVFHQVLEAVVAILGFAKVALAVEVDVAEHAFELGLVGFLDGVEHDVDEFADVGLVAPLVQAVEVGQKTILHFAGLRVFEFRHRNHETFSFQSATDAYFVVTIFFFVLCVMIFPHIGDVFQEQHHQNVVLVLCRIDDPAKGIACGPRG